MPVGPCGIGWLVKNLVITRRPQVGGRIGKVKGWSKKNLVPRWELTGLIGMGYMSKNVPVLWPKNSLSRLFRALCPHPIGLHPCLPDTTSIPALSRTSRGHSTLIEWTFCNLSAPLRSTSRSANLGERPECPNASGRPATTCGLGVFIEEGGLSLICFMACETGPRCGQRDEIQRNVSHITMACPERGHLTKQNLS